MDTHLVVLVVIASVFTTAYGLECYACENQDNNRDKCVTTTKQCTQFQDACTTYVRWGVPPYWNSHGDRIYYITKDCDTRQGCDKRQAATASHCKRDWYLDWACVECCTGDLCNYYVTMGAPGQQISLVTMAVAVFTSILLLRNLV